MKNFINRVQNAVGAGLVSARDRRGITLISLVITIIILIILAGITINLTIGENGIFNKSKYAKEETNKQTATEKINLKITTAQMETYAQEQRMPTLKELSLVLEKDNEIAYVTEVSQIASTIYEVGDNPTSIFTKLKNYDYEFEINSQLQLASINGIAVATNNNTMPAPKLLWENSNPSNASGFAAQTITLPENNCDIFEIYYYWYYTATTMVSQKCILKNNGIITMLFGANPSSVASNGTLSFYRNVTFNTNTSISFDDAYFGCTGKAHIANNIYIIPAYILGYETGLFTQNAE